MELIEESIISNEKIIVFSQFTSSLDKLELLFQKSNYNYLRLDGSTTKINRNQYVEQFQNQTSGNVIFLISLKSSVLLLKLI